MDDYRIHIDAAMKKLLHAEAEQQELFVAQFCYRMNLSPDEVVLTTETDHTGGIITKRFGLDVKRPTEQRVYVRDLEATIERLMYEVRDLQRLCEQHGIEVPSE